MVKPKSKKPAPEAEPKKHAAPEAVPAAKQPARRSSTDTKPSPLGSVIAAKSKSAQIAAAVVAAGTKLPDAEHPLAAALQNMGNIKTEASMHNATENSLFIPMAFVAATCSAFPLRAQRQ